MQSFTTDNLVVVIDLGTSKVRGIVGRKDENGHVEIIAYEGLTSKGVKRGSICNLAEAAFCIKEILAKLQNKVNFIFNEGHSEEERKAYEINGVYVGLNGQTIKTMNSRVPRNLGDVEVTEEVVKTLHAENNKLKIENGEILEIVAQEYLVDDCDEVNPVGCICTRIEGRYKIIAGRPSLKSNLVKCFDKVNEVIENNGGCKIEILGVFLSPIAAASAVLSNEEKELGCAMIDFGAGTTSTAVYYKNVLRHVSVVPFGSDVITKDIMDLKVLENVAEMLKRKFGSAMEELVEDFHISTPPPISGKEGKTVSNKFLAGIIEARIEEILDYVCYQIEKSEHYCHIDEIVITGGGARLKNLVEKLKLRTGFDVRIGKPNQKISSNMDVSYLEVECAQLIGLLIHAEKACVREKAPFSKEEQSEQETPVKKEKKKIKWSNVVGLFGDIFEDSKI
jgi:cell division protein FtsA